MESKNEEEWYKVIYAAMMGYNTKSNQTHQQIQLQHWDVEKHKLEELPKYVMIDPMEQMDMAKQGNLP